MGAGVARALYSEKSEAPGGRDRAGDAGTLLPKPLSGGLSTGQHVPPPSSPTTGLHPALLSGSPKATGELLILGNIHCTSVQSK